VFQQVGSAEEVYDRPANLFVADFVGEPRMNLIAGTAVAVPDGLRIHLSDVAFVDLPSSVSTERREVTLGIRPQDLQVCGPDDPGAVAATVFAYEPLQEVGRLTLSLPGVENRVVVETHHDFWADGGDRIGLRFDPARTHLFDNATGARIEWSSTPHVVLSRPS
jgi:multiple sugar transport system ATP-binding protein